MTILLANFQEDKKRIDTIQRIDIIINNFVENVLMNNFIENVSKYVLVPY